MWHFRLHLDPSLTLAVALGLQDGRGNVWCHYHALLDQLTHCSECCASPQHPVITNNVHTSLWKAFKNMSESLLWDQSIKGGHTSKETRPDWLLELWHMLVVLNYRLLSQDNLKFLNLNHVFSPDLWKDWVEAVLGLNQAWQQENWKSNPHLDWKL